MPDSGKRYTFRKPERICNQNQIDKLFKEGKWIRVSSFRLLALESESNRQTQVQILIAVPKKSLRRAVDRNRMKRLIREAYRLNKQRLTDSYSSSGKHCDIAIVFNGRQCISQSETTTAIIGILERLISVNEKHSD